GGVADQRERLQAALAGHYTIDRELGHGGMAIVYLAHDVRHDRRVALKVLRPEIAAALGAERFLREIHIAAGLSHPNILPLYDSGDAGGVLYYVMPYVEGESLRDRLTREGPMPLGDALAIATETADALGHAHTHDVVHRDVKPENILLSGGHALVADFGIARAISAAGGAPLTETGMRIGTPADRRPAPPAVRFPTAAELRAALLSADAPPARPRALIGVLALVVTLVAGAVYLALRRPASVAPPRSVAVLPFQNLSTDPSDEYFSTGMSEELTTALGKVDALRVAAPTSAGGVRNAAVTARQIGKALGVVTL